MKKLIITALVLFLGFSSTLLLAETSSKSASNPTELQQEYQRAKELYDAKQYPQAYSAFENLRQKSPDNAVINFYLGMSAAALGDTNEAIAAFDRVLILNPQSARTRLELAKLYFAMGEYQMAHAELDIALRTSLPDAVRSNVLAFKQQIDKKQSRHTNATTLVLGLGYDSNANNDIGSGTSFTLDGFGGLELSGRSEVGDYGFSQTLLHNHSYDFGERGGWLLDSHLVAFNKLNKDYGQNDVLYFAGSTAPTYQHDIYKVGFPIELDRVFLEGKGFMTNASAGAYLEQLLSARQIFKASYKYRSMQYDGDNSVRDALANIYAVNYRQMFGERPIILSVNASYEDRQQSKSTVNDPASLTEKLLRVELAKAIYPRLRAHIGMSYRATDYQAETFIFANKRADKIMRYELGGMYQLNRAGIISASLSHANHTSNQGPYEFNKTLLNANYIHRF